VESRIKRGSRVKCSKEVQTQFAGEEGDAFGSVGALIARPPNPPSASEQARYSVGVGGQPELGLRSDEG
jgi:hypothetical protein